MYCGIMSTEAWRCWRIPKLDIADKNSHKGVVHELIHEAAYGATSPMGHSQQAPRDRIPNPTAQVVRVIWKNAFLSIEWFLRVRSGVRHGNSG